jgi:hypothetical protein
MKRHSTLFVWLVLAFCLWQSRDLLDAWRHAPFDRLDPLVFAIWASPLALAWVRHGIGAGANVTLLLLAATVSLLGAISDLNVLQQVALAAALGSCLASDAAALTPWLLAAIAWMPAFGWFASALGLQGVIAARLTIAVTAAAWGWRALSPTSKIHCA